MELPFYPGKKPDHAEPLSIFLPPHHEGVGREFLRRFGGPNFRIADPFGQSPALVLELARAGAAVVAASPNPVIRALLGLQAEQPSSTVLRSVYIRLSNLPETPSHPETTFEQHIRSLYLSFCSSCGNEVEADGFIWEREEQKESELNNAKTKSRDRQKEKEEARYRLTGRVYRCSFCSHAAEEPSLATDEKLAEPYLRKSGYYHLALEKIASLHDLNRPHAEEALEVYPPRSIYALFSILSKFESMGLNAQDRLCADLLLLALLDSSHVLRGHGHMARSRPRSLQRPAIYYEANIWKLLEIAVEDWSLPAERVPICKWKPGMKIREGEIHLFSGSARELAPHLKEVRPDAVISYLPRPNQAAWTLSAMWAGWLWGRKATESLGNVLHRRRYDWNWHARALHSSAAALAANLIAATPIAGIIGESEPGFLGAAIWSFYQAGFELKGLALRADTDTAQLVWHAPAPGGGFHLVSPHSSEPMREVARLASRKLISWRAEPTQWELLHAAAWAEAANRHMLPPLQAENEENRIPDVTDTAEDEQDESGFSRCQAIFHESIEEDPELATAPHEESDLGQTWWLPDAERVASPLSDIVEAEVHRLLVDRAPVAAEELDAEVCVLLPGLQTPEAKLVRACLQSYGWKHADHSLWNLRDEDLVENRERELVDVRSLLAALADKLHMQTEGDNPIVWKDLAGKRVYNFCLMASAEIGRFLLDPRWEPAISWIVLPGGRASLVEYKLRRNVRLHRAVERGWRFLKFRHVRRLSEDPLLQEDNVDRRMALDPLGASGDQISFF